MKNTERLRILYVDAILAQSSADCLLRGLERGFLSSKLIKKRGLKLTRISIHPKNGKNPKAFFKQVLKQNWDAVVFSGSEKSVTNYKKDKWVNNYIEGLKIFLAAWKKLPQPFPVLGICFAHQAISAALGGKVRFSGDLKLGPVDVEKTPKAKSSKFFKDVSKKDWGNFIAYHSDHVVRAPKELSCFLKSDYCQHQAFVHPRLPLVTCQFHPEMDEEILKDSSDKETWKKFKAKDFKQQEGREFLKAFGESCLKTIR